MIAGLRGEIVSKSDDAILVDVNGVIYRVGTSTNTLAETGTAGDAIELMTALIVREDALTLYGFATAEELRFFEVMTAISGIGPRLACSILSTFKPDGLFAAVQFTPSQAVALIGLGISPFIVLAVPARYVIQAEHRFGSELCGAICTASQFITGVSAPALDTFYVRSALDRRQ